MSYTAIPRERFLESAVSIELDEHTILCSQCKTEIKDPMIWVNDKDEIHCSICRRRDHCLDYGFRV